MCVCVCQATSAWAGHSLGPPHLHRWLKLVEVLLADPKLAPTARCSRATGDGGGARHRLLGMRQCRLSRTYSPLTKRQQIRVEDPAVRRAVLCALVGNSQVKRGRSPPSGRERELRELIRGDLWAGHS